MATPEPTGHTLAVGYTPYRVELTVMCHEQTADCRLYCPEGCESWNKDSHVHRLLLGTYCNAAEWINTDDDPFNCCVAKEDFPLTDGMPIAVSWEGDYYGWRPAA